MKQFLYYLEPSRAAMLRDGPTDQEADTVARHFGYLQDLLQQKILLMAGRTQTDGENTFGIVIFETASEAQARQIMANDPAVQDGVMRAQLFPYAVALWSENGPGAEPDQAQLH